MNSSTGKDVMLKRHEIVVRIIDVNSRALRLDNELNGIDIERRNAEREFLTRPCAETRNALEDFLGRAEQLKEKREKLEVEKTWLEQSLDEFDTASRDGDAARDKNLGRVS